MSLTEYQRKRDFKRTPEPKGGRPEAAPLRRYVVHRHHATRLHWDVRLEMRGVLVSFAVPQGPPLEAGKRRLAVHTEDHPIEYKVRFRWDELSALGRPDAFTIANMAARLASVGDVLGASIGMDQKIPLAPAAPARAKPSRRR